MCELPLLPLFMPSLKAMFSESYAGMEDKTARRALKKQLETKLQKQSTEASELEDRAKDCQTRAQTT